MDYGNTPQNGDFALDDENLNTEGGNWDSANQDNMAPEHDSRVIGNKTISAPEITPEQPTTPELGQITPSMPPGYPESTPDTTDSVPAHSSPKAISFHRQDVMHGDNLGNKTIDALKDDERELDATGDAATFFDKIVAAREEFQGKEITS